MSMRARVGRHAAGLAGSRSRGVARGRAARWGLDACGVRFERRARPGIGSVPSSVVPVGGRRPAWTRCSRWMHVAAAASRGWRGRQRAQGRSGSVRYPPSGSAALAARYTPRPACCTNTAPYDAAATMPGNTGRDIPWPTRTSCSKAGEEIKKKTDFYFVSQERKEFT